MKENMLQILDISFEICYNNIVRKGRAARKRAGTLFWSMRDGT